MSFNVSKACKFTRVSNAAAAGTSAINSAVIDTKGFKGTTFIVAFGTIVENAVTSVKVQQGAASNLSDAADLEGTSISVADDDDNQIVIVEIDDARERYLRCVVSRATQNSTVDGIVAMQHNADEEPVTHDASTVVGSEYHLAPAEGTA
jgi:hypothetical protein